MSSIRLGELHAADVDAIVTVHCAAFPRSAMTRLGSEAVKRYYLWQLTGPHETYARGAWSDDRLVGFCFGGIHPTAISGFLERNKRYIAWRLATRPWLLTTPLFRDRIRFALRVLRFRRPAGSEEVPQRTDEKLPYDILSIAVDPKHHGEGIGKLLIADAERIAIEHDFRTMTLVVRPENERAVRFYERGGWQRVLNGGHWDGGMEKRLTPSSTPSFSAI